MPRSFHYLLNVADAERVELWEHGLHVTHGAGTALKSDLKPKLEIVYSVSLSVSSLLQSKQASASELASGHISLKVGNLSSAHLSVVACGDMDMGQRILQGPCGFTRAPKSPVTRIDEVYERSDAQR